METVTEDSGAAVQGKISSEPAGWQHRLTGAHIDSQGPNSAQNPRFFVIPRTSGFTKMVDDFPENFGRDDHRDRTKSRCGEFKFKF